MKSIWILIRRSDTGAGLRFVSCLSRAMSTLANSMGSNIQSIHLDIAPPSHFPKLCDIIMVRN